MINREKLIEMMDGDEAIADKFIQAFKEQVRKQLPLMQEYLQTAQYDQLSNAAHVMKTQTAYMGLEALSGLCQRIENMAKNDAGLEQLPGRVQELTEQLAQYVRV